MGTQVIASEPVVIRTERDHASIEAPASERASILVVEDEHLVALDIQRGLERMGHAATIAYSGESALALTATAHFDLMLMDIKLRGEIDGIKTADRIRRRHDIPIIYLTAYADNLTLGRARLTEPYGYVLKPFQERELRAAISLALQRHMEDRLRRRGERVQRFLAAASARLAASLDYKAVASDAAELLVPEHADYCVVHLDERNDSVPALTRTCPSRGTSLLGGEIGDAIGNVLRTGATTGIVELESEPTGRTLLCMPIRARGSVLGALALVCDASRAGFRPSDVQWVEDFCDRLGVALDNALLYRSAERAIAMRDDVLAIVSHDLRSPLGTILMQAELLAQRPELGKIGMQIARCAELMNRLIGDLLDASAINAGRLALDRRRTGLTETLMEAGDTFRSKAEAAGIDLRVAGLVPDGFVSCDRDRIVQVLSNLIGNAIKFTERGGRVDVSAARSDGDITIEVRDNGPGIAAEQVPHLFERFWRAKAERHGAGLGLFISQGILASHGASLELETEEGKGSRFFFRLPELGDDRD
jgi:signal transduction histidine kinase/CheY-like chemotaxis protein